MFGNPLPHRPRAVLFDRDGTLIRDVPYNTDPDRVHPLPGAVEALNRLRAAGVLVGIVSNQSGVGTGRISLAQLAAVNCRVERELGPFEVIEVCPHRPEAGCRCRKPAPGLVLSACRELRVKPTDVLVVGDIGADVEAAAAAGAEGLLIPAPATRADERARAPRVASSLAEVADLVCAAPVRSLAGAS